MKRSPLQPMNHLFVCTNRREAGSSLGPGCAERGDAVLEACRAKVAERGALRALWVTQTRCLGLCPREGVAVAVYPQMGLLTEVHPGDAEGLVHTLLASRS